MEKGVNARNALIAVAGNISTPLFGFAVSPILAHALGVDGRGAVAAATAPVMFIVAALTLGIPEALTYHVAQGAASRRLVLLATSISLAVSVVAVCALIALSQNLAGGNDKLAHVIVICSFGAAPGLLLGVLRALAAGRNEWTRITVEKFAVGVTRLIGLSVLAGLGSINAASASAVVAYSSIIGIVAYLLRRRRRTATEAHPEATSRRKFFVFSINIWLGAVAGILLSRLDQLLLTPIAGVRELGLYVVAVNIAEVPVMISLAVRDVVMSSQASRPSDEQVALAGRISLLATCILSALIASTMPFWIGAAFGDAFRAAMPAATIMLIASCLGAPGSVAGAGLVARGVPHLRSLAIGLAVPVNVACLVVLATDWGAVGASVATLIGGLAASTGTVLFLRSRSRLKARDLFIVRSKDIAYLYRVCRPLLSAKRP